jgi:hypothetical protein
MSKIRMDFARNEISDMSFICLDPVFFTDGYKTAKKTELDQREEKKEQLKSTEKVDFNKLSGNLQNSLARGMQGQSPTKPLKLPTRVKVDEDDFGFASDSSEDEVSA